MSSRQSRNAFLITAPGLEALASAELTALGVAEPRRTEGGVEFSASPRTLYAANLHLRTASRVVVRVAEFVATAFYELERKAAKVSWETFLSPNLTLVLRVTCRKSRLYHSDAVAERIAGVIGKRVPGIHVAGNAEPRTEDSDVIPSAARNRRPTGRGPSVGTTAIPRLTARDDNDALFPVPGSRFPINSAQQLVLVRFLHDRCTISVDSSGGLLHLRGYRQAVAKAPMRETLAAAVLIASGWRGDAPLIDPMCGSGTIPIEAALIARRIAPGLRRRFAFEDWPDFDATTWREVVADAEASILPRSPVRIQGSDRDAGAITAARANAERAGVSEDIEFDERPVSAVDPPPEPGWVVSNPPYGVRVGERDRLRNLYAQVGKVLRAKCGGWQVALVSADETLERQLRLPLKPILSTSNGGIKVRVVAGQVPAASQDPERDTESPSTAAAQRYPS